MDLKKQMDAFNFNGTIFYFLQIFLKEKRSLALFEKCNCFAFKGNAEIQKRVFRKIISATLVLFFRQGHDSAIRLSYN